MCLGLQWKVQRKSEEKSLGNSSSGWLNLEKLPVSMSLSTLTCCTVLFQWLFWNVWKAVSWAHTAVPDLSNSMPHYSWVSLSNLVFREILGSGIDLSPRRHNGLGAEILGIQDNSGLWSGALSVGNQLWWYYWRQHLNAPQWHFLIWTVRLWQTLTQMFPLSSI